MVTHKQITTTIAVAFLSSPKAVQGYRSIAGRPLIHQSAYLYAEACHYLIQALTKLTSSGLYSSKGIALHVEKVYCVIKWAIEVKMGCWEQPRHDTHRQGTARGGVPGWCRGTADRSTPRFNLKNT
jgi:hypothetical protein